MAANQNSCSLCLIICLFNCFSDKYDQNLSGRVLWIIHNADREVGISTDSCTLTMFSDASTYMEVEKKISQK